MPNPLTYISLFSSAGVGCYGFFLEGFQCVATNELVERRLAVQRSNNKCKYNSGYILGDIANATIQKRLFNEITMWREKEKVMDIDVIIATPPCQGMSVANHKKNGQDLQRNSLIVVSIDIISKVLPKVVIFENVPLFMKTICTDTDGVERPIAKVIERNLGERYSIFSRVLNFKDYGACSSRSRTLVIAVRQDLSDFFSPIELFPQYKPECTLRQCIGSMKRLELWGEIDGNDIYHNFRIYPENMRSWISELKEGQSAFENNEINRIPHQIKDGKIVTNQRKNGDKYRRLQWDKVGPCVHTRNDQLASQNTIHPSDDRVFSIRELMMMMTIPLEFRWVDININDLNAMSDLAKREFLKKNEINIRQSLGEAVPTEVFRSIAANIRTMLNKRYMKDMEIKTEINAESLYDIDRLKAYIRLNPRNLGFASLCRIAELANSNRNEQEAYFTNKSIITEIIKNLPQVPSARVKVLEPSVGAGNFIPFLVKFFADKQKVDLTVVDIDKDALAVLKELLLHIELTDNISIEFICNDFLFGLSYEHYDLVIGNPPFSKSARGKLLENYRSSSVNKQATNTSAFFFEKALSVGSYVAMIMPKSLLNTPEYAVTRDLLASLRMDAVIDFGERGFGGVLIETMAVLVNPTARASKTTVVSITDSENRIVPQRYICDEKFPYWIIYRNEEFDRVCRMMRFNIFEVFRDRQLTNSLITYENSGIRVVRSRNISDDGSEIVDIDGYDAYISPDKALHLCVHRYIDDDSVYLTPNMTYKPRVIRKPKGVLVNGSVAILILKEGQSPLSDKEMRYFSTDEYRTFYRTARNRQTRSLNVDANSVFFFGRLTIEETDKK